MVAAQLWFALVLGGSTFFAPCAYPLLPGYLAYFLGNAESADSRLGTVARAAGDRRPGDGNRHGRRDSD